MKKKLQLHVRSGGPCDIPVEKIIRSMNASTPETDSAVQLWGQPLIDRFKQVSLTSTTAHSARQRVLGEERDQKNLVQSLSRERLARGLAQARSQEMPGESPVDASVARWGGEDDVKGPETQDGKWEDEVKGKEDKALLNLITQTAKKSSYNNSKRHGLNASDDEINKRHGLSAGGGDDINKRHGLNASGNDINKKRASSVLSVARLAAKFDLASVETGPTPYLSVADLHRMCSRRESVNMA